MTKLLFDGPGWGGCGTGRLRGETYFDEVVGGVRQQTFIGRGDVVEADLEDGSLRSACLKQHIERGLCRVLEGKRKAS